MELNIKVNEVRVDVIFETKIGVNLITIAPPFKQVYLQHLLTSNSLWEFSADIRKTRTYSVPKVQTHLCLGQ